MSDDFDRFWAAYPRKCSKGHAERAFRAARLTAQQLEDVVLPALEAQKSWRSWREAGGRYIPYPATWLRGKRWLDEPSGVDRPPSRSWRAGCRHEPPCESPIWHQALLLRESQKKVS